MVQLGRNTTEGADTEVSRGSIVYDFRRGLLGMQLRTMVKPGWKLQGCRLSFHQK